MTRRGFIGGLLALPFAPPVFKEKSRLEQHANQRLQDFKNAFKYKLIGISGDQPSSAIIRVPKHITREKAKISATTDAEILDLMVRAQD